MIDISSNDVLPIAPLNTIARAILGEDTAGVSVGDNSRIHLLDDTQANRDICQAIFDGYDALAVTASATILDEGDSDPTITCSDSVIMGDSDVGYVVLLDGEVYADGTTTVSSGTATLNLVSPVAGVYEVFMYRLTGDYASNSVQITVSEV